MMRKAIIVLTAVVAVGCARAEDEIAADSPAAAAMPAPLSFADFAGRWSIQLLGETSDSVLSMYELNATADGSSWTLTPNGREPIPVRAAVESDSLLIDVGRTRASNRPIST